MMGVTVRNIPDGRRIFLPDDFPEGIYPWRKDGKGIPPEMVKRLWAAGRPAEAKPE
jgi:membrane-bound hydrogenase subunit beta